MSQFQFTLEQLTMAEEKKKYSNGIWEVVLWVSHLDFQVHRE